MNHQDAKTPRTAFRRPGARRTWCLGVLVVGASLPLWAQQASPPAGQEKPKEGRAAYVRRMYEKDRATFGDACRSVLGFVRGEPAEGDFAANEKDLLARSIVEENWGGDSGPLTKGTLAFMLCKALGIKGGFTMSILGASRRYALREAIYLGLMPRGSPGQFVSGRELIDVITNAEIYKEKGTLESVHK